MPNRHYDGPGSNSYNPGPYLDNRNQLDYNPSTIKFSGGFKMSATLVTPTTVEEARAYVLADYGRIVDVIELPREDGTWNRTVIFNDTEDNCWLCSVVTTDAPKVGSDEWYIEHATRYEVTEDDPMWTNPELADYPIVLVG